MALRPASRRPALRHPAPRARVRGGRLIAAALLAWLGVASAASAQDTVQVADSLQAMDTVQVAGALPGMIPDSLLPGGDSVAVIRVLPSLPGTRRAADPARIAFWSRDDLILARALTLLELVSTLPGAIPLRTNDYGAPEGLVMTGRAGGRLRVFIDGSEETALDGSVPDLSQFSIGGLASVEMTRSGGETRIFLETLQASDTVPVSTIEAGTGDLDTNIFRGTFVHPDAFGGSLGLVFERLDSQGVGNQGTGSLQNVWFRYLRSLGDRFTIQGDIRNRKAESLLDRAAPEATRSTRSLRIRGRLFEGVGVEAYVTENRLDLTSDTVIDDRPRNMQTGLRLGWESAAAWGRAEVRHMNPAGRPNLFRADADAGLTIEGLGGVSGRFGFDRIAGERRIIWGVSGWTRPLYGVSAYASYDRGQRGWFLPATPGLQTAPDSLLDIYRAGSDGLFVRAGLRASLGPLTLDAAALRNDVDRILPLGTRVDLGGSAFPGDVVNGFEVSGSLGLPVSGFQLEGSLQQWQDEGVYRPRRIYRGGISFHDTFYPTGNLEITASTLVEGRDPMLLPILDPNTGGPVRVPFYQSWNAYLQIRVVTVRIFIRWDNLFIRAANQDIPELLLPRTRAMYGVRWTLRN